MWGRWGADAKYCGILPVGAQFPTCYMGRKSLHASDRGRVGTVSNTPEHFVLNRACLSRKLVHQNLTYLAIITAMAEGERK